MESANKKHENWPNEPVFEVLQKSNIPRVVWAEESKTGL